MNTQCVPETGKVSVSTKTIRIPRTSQSFQNVIQFYSKTTIK